MKMILPLILLLLSLSLATAQNASLPDPPPLTMQEEPETSYDCDPSCVDTEFCGRDLQCHGYSCEAWYELAHPFFTYYSPGISGLLECREELEDRAFLQAGTPCGTDLPLGAEYIAPEASSTFCFDPYREDQLASYAFTRKCTAQPTNETGFVCYDLNMNEDFDAYTADYVDHSQELNGTHTYTLYVEGYTMRQNEDPSNEYEYPSSIGQFRSLGEFGEDDRSTFNATAARAAMYSRSFPKYDSPLPNCGRGCRLHEFCGEDRVCHNINCDNFWMYGPQAFTGRQLAFDLDLSCSLQLQNSSANPCGDSNWPVALQYMCRPENIFSRTDVCLDNDNDETRHVSFHRMCTAKPSPTQEFVCFDLKQVPDLEAYVADYVQSTSANPNCTEQEMNMWPLSQSDLDKKWVAYHHQTHRIRNNSFGTSLYIRPPYQYASQEPLDLMSLDHTMFSRLAGSAPPDESPELEDESTSAAIRIHWSVAYLSSLLIIIGTLLVAYCQ